MIICWNVLEHLKRPEEALKRFHKGLKQGGIIVIMAPIPFQPNASSPKSLPTLSMSGSTELYEAGRKLAETVILHFQHICVFQ